ncbi:alpha/beta hydrolase [Acidovorax cavernicola]|uniref:Alpha/beta hydrolase n=1 Tax=Acidovorax cavernicola TaxID=1675792 RepID=A0A9X8GTK4_9BURK|nr:alpha/beta hydrolase [Acidovorax cavernicola]RIX75932.1 alpha/beta hydrolase [Acidovorax cavernicola]
MNSKQLLAISAAAFALLGTAGAAHAETYEGVHAITSAASRADVRTEAVAAARAGNEYSDAVSASVAPVLASSVDRATVRSQAVATAHAPGQNLKREAFVGSVIPTQAREFTRQAGL